MIYKWLICVYRHVLVAEDTTAIQMVIRKILEGKGLEVIIVGGGKQAIEQAMNNTFDIIFMDMQMPVMGGIEATSILREKNITTPVYAFTANVMVRDRELFYAAGC